MDNRQDIENIKEQLEAVKNNNQSSLENLDAINLIIVDNNNGRVKDLVVSAQMARLRDKLREMSAAITETEEILKDK